MSPMRAASAARTAAGSSSSHNNSSSSRVRVSSGMPSAPGFTLPGYVLQGRCPAALGDGRRDAYSPWAMAEAAPAGEIPYTVRRSARARSVRVNVHAHSGVEVVLPARAPERAAAAAVSELRPWIERRLSEAREVLAAVAARAGTVPYLGSTLELVPQEGRTRVHRSGERLFVPGGDHRPALERFFKRAARSEIAPRLDHATA